VTSLKSAFGEASLHLQLWLNTVGFVIFLTDKHLKGLLLDERGGLNLENEVFAEIN